jgi:hypothetical protein
MERITELDLGFEPCSNDRKESLRMAVESMADSRQHPKLENWILRNFSDAYNRVTIMEKLEWVRRGTPPMEPDFLVFTQPDGTPIPIEVTEVLDPGRKRQEEYKSAWEQAEQAGDYLVASGVLEPWPSYEEALIAKARDGLVKKYSKKKYPHGTWLVVYFNPTLFMPLHEDTRVFAMHVMQTAIDSLPPPERISQVWILTQDMQITRLRIDSAAHTTSTKTLNLEIRRAPQPTRQLVQNLADTYIKLFCGCQVKFAEDGSYEFTQRCDDDSLCIADRQLRQLRTQKNL